MWCWFFAGHTFGGISSQSVKAGRSTKSGPWPGCGEFAICIATIVNGESPRLAPRSSLPPTRSCDKPWRPCEAQADAELADPKLPTPCRKVLVSLQEHWDGLTRFVDDLRIPLDNNASERQARGPALGRKNYYGSARYGADGWRRCSFPCLPP